jgi:hypothetical protein
MSETCCCCSRASFFFWTTRIIEALILQKDPQQSIEIHQWSWRTSRHKHTHASRTRRVVPASNSCWRMGSGASNSCLNYSLRSLVRNTEYY